MIVVTFVIIYAAAIIGKPNLSVQPLRPILDTEETTQSADLKTKQIL
jgi:hypothetical protein